MVTEMGSSAVGGMSPALSANAAKSFLEAADKEKKEMQGLNDRLGNYIDRVKKLEEQNRKLVADLEDLRGRWGKDTSDIKASARLAFRPAGYSPPFRSNTPTIFRRLAKTSTMRRVRRRRSTSRSRVFARTSRSIAIGEPPASYFLLLNCATRTHFSYDELQRRRESDRENIANFTNQIADAQNELEMLRARWKQLTDEEKRLLTGRNKKQRDSSLQMLVFTLK